MTPNNLYVQKESSRPEHRDFGQIALAELEAELAAAEQRSRAPLASRARRLGALVKFGRGPQIASRKIPVTIRLSPQVVAGSHASTRCCATTSR